MLDIKHIDKYDTLKTIYLRKSRLLLFNNKIGDFLRFIYKKLLLR